RTEEGLLERDAGSEANEARALKLEDGVVGIGADRGDRSIVRRRGRRSERVALKNGPAVEQIEEVGGERDLERLDRDHLLDPEVGVEHVLVPAVRELAYDVVAGAEAVARIEPHEVDIRIA